jgi:hypothetical protein
LNDAGALANDRDQTAAPWSSKYVSPTRRRSKALYAAWS